MKKKILIAVAWPYVNGNIHVGHLAGYLIPADIIARYQRLRGNDVLMVSGSDCHGTPITIEADKTNSTAGEVVKKYHSEDVALFKKYKLSYNLYTTTTTAKHKEVTQEIFLNLLNKGLIITKEEKQYYSEEDKKFLPDRYVEGTCPYCSTPDQRGDQCENCGRMIEQGALLNPISKLTGNPVILKDTEHYYLNLPDLEKELKEYIKDKKEIWKEWVYNETDGWLKDGLLPRAITRDIDWGVEIPADRIPDDKKIKGIENKRFYVWFEAVIGYLSASQEFMDYKNGEEVKNEIILDLDSVESKNWKDFWPSYAKASEGDNSDVYHYYFMGQDNVVFHSIMWPAELIGAYDNIHKPDNVAANKFMNFKGKKFSKSRGWIVDSNEIADEFGIDPVRFFIASNLPENKESNFTWEEFIDAINNELVANLGNFINRTLVFSKKNFETVTGDLNESVAKVIEETYTNTSKLLDKVEITKALNEIMKLAAFGNKYFNDSEVWKVVKEDSKKAENIIYNCFALVDSLSKLISPFVPDAADKIKEMMDLEKKSSLGTDTWKYNKVETYKVGTPEILFAKIDKAVVLPTKES